MLKQNELKTEVYLLQDILKWISEGRLRVPKFQRSFVWDEQQMIDLFESIGNDYPIGSLLFWDTKEKYKSQDIIGPYKITALAADNNIYILDGHQRLSTLFGALIKPSSTNYSNIDEHWKWKIYYDLEDQAFKHLKNKQNKNHQIPIYAMFDTFEFLSANKKLQKNFPKEAETYINRLEVFYNLMRNVRIAVIQIKSNDLNQAIEIFSKLNSTGMNITPVQMYEALTYEEDKFNLTDEIESIQNKLELMHFELDKTFVFRSILSMLDVDIYKHNIENLSIEKKDYLENAIQRIKHSIELAIKFLKVELGVFIRSLLPYKLQLIYLGVFFDKCDDPSQHQISLLKKWFWHSTYTGWFASTHSRMIQDGLNEMKSLAKGNLTALYSLTEMGEVQKFPKYYNTRSVRVKAFILFLNSLKPKSLCSGENLKLEQLYIEYGLGVVSNFFSKDKSRANKFIRDPKDEIKFNKLQIEEVLVSNALTRKIYEEFLMSTNKTFFELREEYILELEKRFIEKNISKN